jgi:DnaJ-class molecular chaperone
MSNLIVTCPSCSGKYNGRNITHAHTGASAIDKRFLTCNRCRGQGSITCERCQGAGRIVLENGVQVGIFARPATSQVLGPNPKKVLGGPR